MKDQDEFFKHRINDLKSMAFQRDIVTFTDFLDLHQLHMINDLRNDVPGVATETFGGYECAERQIAAFIPDALSYGWEYPLCCLKIVRGAEKDPRPLDHRDYLGAMMHLGVERSVLGDILLLEDGAYFFCVDTMADFFVQELVRVRHTPVRTQILPHTEQIPEPVRRPVQGTVSSVRLDAVIAVAFGGSRTKLTPLIQGGKVYVNSRQVTSNGYTLREGDIISVRGKGKFRFQQIISRTKKGKYAVHLEIYQ